MAIPKFGASGSVETVTTAKNTETLELQDEFHTYVFTNRYQDVLTFSNPTEYSCTYGAMNWAGSIVSSATIDITEEQIEPTPSAINPGTVPTTTDKLTKVDCLIIKRARVTLTVEGKGETSYSRGDTMTDAWPVAAVGNVSLDPSTFLSVSTPDLTCTRVEVRDSNTDWESFTVEFTGYIDGASDGSHLITLPSYITPTSPYYYSTLRRTITAEDKATQ